MCPDPHAFIGCEGSVQLVVSTNGASCPGNALMPLPDRTFQYATLTVPSAAAAGTTDPAAARTASTHMHTLRATRLFIGFLPG
jgi:hypothetical protein